MCRDVAGPGLVCASASRVAQGGGGGFQGAARLGLCVSTSGEDIPSSPRMETHNPNRAARRSSAPPCRMARGWGVLSGSLGVVCFHLERGLLVLSQGGNTQPQLRAAAYGRVLLCLVVTVPHFFLYFTGGRGWARSIDPTVISYHIILAQFVLKRTIWWLKN